MTLVELTELPRDKTWHKLSRAPSAVHSGWLDRIAQMDVPASSYVAREALGWQPREGSGFLAHLAITAIIGLVQP
jgi:hypothetical protein